MTAVVDELAALLAAHVMVGGAWFDHDRKTTYYRCECGETCYALDHPNHHEHVAEVIAEHFAAVTAERDAADAKVAAVVSVKGAWETRADAIAITYQNPDDRRRATALPRQFVSDLRAALDTQPTATEGANHD